MTVRRALAAALVWALATLGVLGDNCSSFQDCDTCRASSFACHWCSDGRCHAVGSPYGCIYGTYCYDNDQCQRKEPEFRGYAKPSFAALLGVGLVGGTIAMCAIAAIVLARDFAKAGEEQDVYVMGYYAMPDESDEEDTGLPGPSAPPKTDASTDEAAAAAGTGTDSKHRVAGINSGRGWRLRGMAISTGPSPTRRSGNSSSSRRRRQQQQRVSAGRRFSGRVYTCTKLLCGLCMAIVIAVSSVVLVYAPHAPGVNVCNTQFDWGSIVKSIKKIDVEADFQLLISIYNPNYMNLEILGGTAVLRHKHVEVGQMVFEPFMALGGHVTDVLFTIQIDGKAWDDLHLGVEYQTNVLAFLMDATVTAAIDWQGHKTFPFTFSINNFYIKVADAENMGRELCNCPSIMKAARPEPPVTKALPAP